MFSEAEGNEVLLGLRKGSAKLSPQKGPIYIINQRKSTTQTNELEQTLSKPLNKDAKKVRNLISTVEGNLTISHIFGRYLGD